MARVLIVGGYAKFIVNFRGALLKRLVESGHSVFAAAPGHDEDVEQELRDMGVSYLATVMDRAGMNPLSDLWFILKIRKQMLEIKPDIVISYNIKPVIYASLAARLAGVKNIYSIITGLGYGFLATGLKNFLLKTLVKLLYGVSMFFNKKVFFQNNDDLELFCDLKILKNRKKAVLINGSGVDVEHFSLKPLPENFSFLMIARLLVDKGVREYFEAAEILKAKYPDVILKLVGWIDVNPSAISKNELDEKVASGIIDYLGRQEDVRPAIESSTVYVLPSYREGMPRTVLEAMSMGRPIITTDVPGCRETVIDGCNGYLIPAKDSSRLAKAMEALLKDSNLVADMGKKSRDIAEDKFSVDKVNDVILNAINL